MSEWDIVHLRQQGVKFVDITYHQDASESSFNVAEEKMPALPAQLSMHNESERALANLSKKYMKGVLTTFSQFHTRYYDSEDGLRASTWLYNVITDLVREAEYPSYVSVGTVSHRWSQNSIIAQIRGSIAPDEVVVVGAHLDSVNQWIPWFGRSPGADDDGSGTVTILDAFRSLINAGFQPERTVEFHWYSGEEGGLLGSQDIAHHYASAQTKVVGMMQMDMTGYYRAEPMIGIINDYTDPELTRFLREVVDSYSSLPWKDMRCGYGCSDHASWNKVGYRSAAPFEDDNVDYPYIHSADDTVDHVDFDHCLEFARVAVGYAVELSKAQLADS